MPGEKETLKEELAFSIRMSGGSSEQSSVLSKVKIDHTEVEGEREREREREREKQKNSDKFTELGLGRLHRDLQNKNSYGRVVFLFLAEKEHINNMS